MTITMMQRIGTVTIVVTITETHLIVADLMRVNLPPGGCVVHVAAASGGMSLHALMLIGACKATLLAIACTTQGILLSAAGLGLESSNTKSCAVHVEVA